ncbi:MAG TPA: hypothetical protein VGG48_18435 [Rhizomicrobium sp.]|jgi:hypothetical protein
MRGTAAILLAGLLGLPALAASPAFMTLKLPRTPTANERVWLSLTTGALPHGAGVRVDAPDGSVIELVTTFGGHSGTGGSSALVPLPQNLIVGDHAQVRLTVVGVGAAHRPTSAEVTDAHLVLVPTTPP